MKKTPVLILAGLSGSGKTAAASAIMETDNRFTMLRSATTRKPRGDGNDGEYIYLSDAEFDEALERGEFAEWASFSGNRYGTLRSEIDRAAGEGKIPLLILEFNGVESLVTAEEYDACAIFVYTDLATASDRLLARTGLSPDGKRPLSWVIRSERNVSDALASVRYAHYFYAAADNRGTIDACRDEILVHFSAFCSGEERRENAVEQSFLSLAAEGMARLGRKQGKA